MRRAPATIGDDCCCTSHDRYPIGISGIRHQHRTWHEAIDVLGIRDDADRSRNDIRADAESRNELAPLPRDLVSPLKTWPPAELHRLRARLDNEQFAASPVLRHRNVHRANIVT